MAEAKVF